MVASVGQLEGCCVGVGGVGGVVLLPCAQVAAASFIRPTSQAKGVCWQPPVAPAQSLWFEGTRAAPPRSLRLLPGHTCVITLSSGWNMLGIKCEFSCPQGSPSCAQGRLLTFTDFGVLATPLSCRLLCCVLATPLDPPGPSPSVTSIIVGILCKLSCTQASVSCAQGRLLTLTIFGVLATPLSCRLLCCVLATPLPPGALAAGHGTPLSPAQSWRDSSCRADSPPLPLTSVSYSHPVRFGPSTMPPCRLGHLPSSLAPPTVHQATLHPLQCRCCRLGHFSSSPLCSTADDFDSIARWYFGRAFTQAGWLSYKCRPPFTGGRVSTTQPQL
jgi:hypothetical protein